MIKRFNTYYLIVMLLMAVCLQARGQGSGKVVTLKKTASQSFPATKNLTLLVNNNFGNIKIVASKRKTILVKAVMLSYAKDAAQATKQLKRIQIEFIKGPDSITCAARVKSDATIAILGNQPPKAGDTVKQRPISIMILPAKWCAVNFEVYLPATQPLNIDNGFGNITMGDYTGPLNIHERFGDFTAGNLTGSTQLELSQGNVNIKHIRFGQMNVKTFDHVNIAGISGGLNSQFQFGRELNLNLKYLSRTDSIGLKANNVQQVNISGVTPITARYTLKLVFSKLQLDGSAFAGDKNIFSFREINADKRKREAQHLDDSILKAHPELKIMPADVTLSVDTVKSKKMKELTILSLAKFKKVHEYVAGPEDARAKVNIGVVFGTLNLTP